MKKVLLATTALIATAAFAAPARAELEVTVGGFAAFQAGWFDNDDTNSSDRDFQSESEIEVRADGTADNGLEYGAFVQLETSTDNSDNAGEVWIYGQGAWGRVELGDAHGAGRMGVYAPTVGIGQINGSYDDFVTSADRGHAINDRGDARFLALDSESSTKVSYFTPKFAGFQAGASYTPEVDSSNLGEAVQFFDNVGDHEDMFEVGATYERDFNNVNFLLSGNYNHADAKNGAGVEDISSWGLGAQLGYAGFRFGGGYTDQGDSGNTAATADDDVSSWNVGATYENGPWGVGISYLATDLDTNGDDSGILGTDGNGGDYSVIAAGGTYTVAPGLTVGADVAFYDRDRSAGADTDGTVVMTDVTAAF